MVLKNKESVNTILIKNRLSKLMSLTDLNDKNNNNKSKINYVYFEDISCEKSLFIFSKTNMLRKVSYYIVKHSKFESFILFIIVISSLKLVSDTYFN